MYRCNKCGCNFEIPQGYHEYYTESIVKWEEGCPECRSLDYEELMRCKKCGAKHTKSGLTAGLCIECEKRIQEKISRFFGQFDENEIYYIFESGILERL